MRNQSRHSKSFTFEFFPPRSEKGEARLAEVRKKLAAMDPEFFSVTFGAGGSTRSGTFNAVLETARSTGMDVAPHLSCIGSSQDFLRDALHAYRKHGVRRV